MIHILVKSKDSLNLQKTMAYNAQCETNASQRIV